MPHDECPKESLLQCQNYLRSPELLENKARKVVVEAAGDQTIAKAKAVTKATINVIKGYSSELLNLDFESSDYCKIF